MTTPTRIYSAGLYVVRRDTGISGFPGPAETVLMRGDAVRARGYHRACSDFRSCAFRRVLWRVEDGRVPEYQNHVTTQAAAEIVAADGSTAVLLEATS